MSFKLKQAAHLGVTSLPAHVVKGHSAVLTPDCVVLVHCVASQRDVPTYLFIRVNYNDL